MTKARTSTVKRCGPVCAAAILSTFAVAPAQQPGPEDQIIDAFRTRDEIGPSDQRRLADWVRTQIDKYTDFQTFRKRFADQFRDNRNSDAFTAQLAAQTGQVAAERFAGGKLKPDVAHALAQVLVDFNRAETFPGLIAGLSFDDVRVRFLCVKGLNLLRDTIAADDARRGQVIDKLRTLGLKEESGVILSRVYTALAFPGRWADVIDTYLALMDHRLEARRKRPVNRTDGAETYAFEYFRTREATAALDAAKKTELVQRVAVFLRMDAERYQAKRLGFLEKDALEREMEAAEGVLKALGISGGDVAGALALGNPDKVLQEVRRWVGDAATGTKGSLNASPWNVPPGAP